MRAYQSQLVFIYIVGCGAVCDTKLYRLYICLLKQRLPQSSVFIIVQSARLVMLQDFTCALVLSTSFTF